MTSATKPTLDIWNLSRAPQPGDLSTLELHLLDDAREHPLLLVLPGGGYGGHANHEAGVICEAFHALGFHGAVLRYRLGPKSKHPDMINDLQRAIRLIRSKAAEWKIQNAKVAILGFSAGGHLASTGAVHFDRWTSPADDLAPAFSARPDAAILCYPVISMTEPMGHMGSRRNLLGHDADPALVDLLSNHLHVKADTSPSFLWHTADDGPVPVENSLAYFGACRKNRVPAELHVYEYGAHGLGLAKDRSDVSTWVGHAGEFLKRHLGK